MNQNGQNTSELLKELSNQDFLNFGVQDIAYIRTSEVDGKTMYAIHAADGNTLAVMDDESTAYTTIRSNNLDAVALQ